MSHRTTRRTFIKHAGYAGASLPLVLPALTRAQPASKKLNVAFVGAAGQGLTHVGAIAKMGENCVCFAEIDKNRWEGPQKNWSSAVGYTDWRKMFEKHEKEIDVVFVATPDHTHFAPSMTAVSLGKHCYTEKPLTWSVRESQLLTQAYLKNTKVVTQMGNQGHAGSGWRRAHAYITSGVLGDITEFHTWTNRPVWPQGYGKPAGEDPIPDSLDWDAWIGPAQMRPYVGTWKEGPFSKRNDDWREKVYHPFAWRGMVDFGSGALGDMACHTTDGIHSIMEPDYPTSIEPMEQSGEVNDHFQVGAKIKWEYPAKGGKPGFKVFWYEGYKTLTPEGQFEDPYMPETPQELAKEERELPRTGNLVVGTKGKMLVTGDYWDGARLIPETFQAQTGKIELKLPESPGHHAEFIMACKGEKPREFSQSNWGYSGPMSAKILLGNVCVRVGKKIEMDPKTGKVTNIPDANDLLWREPRKGWGPLATSV